jgi:hypothetical protein
MEAPRGTIRRGMPFAINVLDTIETGATGVTETIALVGLGTTTLAFGVTEGPAVVVVDVDSSTEAVELVVDTELVVVERTTAMDELE